MNYEEFINYIKEHILECYKEVILYDDTRSEEDKEEMLEALNDAEVGIQTVIKNNGIKLDAFSIHKKGKTSSPNIYIKPYFDAYEVGKPADFILTEMVHQFIRESKAGQFGSIDLSEYELVKDRIVLRLVNYEKNKEMLENFVHRRYLDLAVTYRYLVEDDLQGLATICISNKEMEKWGIDEEILYKDALKNSMVLMPEHVEPLADLVMGFYGEKLKELFPDMDDTEPMFNPFNPFNMFGFDMYIVSNKSKAFGAASIMYDGVLEKIAKTHDANLYIMPSSVHECMVIPETEDADHVLLSKLLKEANASSVGYIDLLSDNIYYYDRECGSIDIIKVVTGLKC